MTRIHWKVQALLGVVLAFAASGDAMAQSLDVLPRGTTIELIGPLSARGADTVGIDLLPEGEYRLRTEAPGHASTRARFEVNGTQARSLRWSGPSAFLVPPGIDHLRNGENRGWYHLFAGVVGASFLFTSIQDLGDAPEGSSEEFDKGNVRDLWVGYLSAVWFSAGLESWALTPRPNVVRRNTGLEITAPRADRWGASLRSVLVPGAGQRYLGNDTRASFFTATVFASAAAAIALQDLYLDARRDSREARTAFAGAGTPAEAAARQVELEDAESTEDTRDLLRWIATGVAAYFYAWNVVDAFSGGAHAESSPGPRLGLAPTHEGMGLAVTWRFD